MRFYILMASTIWITACGVKPSAGDPYDKKATKPYAAMMDQVKYINRDIFDAQDGRSIGQLNYSVHETGRVLIRYTAFTRDVHSILTQQPILLRIHVPKDEAAFARTKLQVCPILKNWMTLATWQKAHVLANGGWSTPGGDFERSACLSVMPEDDKIFKDGREEREFCAGETALCFNLNSWFQSYVQERRSDFGLLIINETAQPISVSGDGSSKYPTVFLRVLL